MCNNEELLDINEKALNEANRLLIELEENINFFRQRLSEQPKLSDVQVHMHLYEHYLNELTSLLGYDSILQEEYKQRYIDIRALNLEIHRLNKLIGNGVPPESVTSKLRTYDDAMRLWYGSHGFDYANLESYSAYGINYRFNGDLSYDKDDGLSSRKERRDSFYSKYPLITAENTVYDIYRDSYHAELLDTDKNKQLIQELLSDNFPNSRILEFHSRHNDFGSFTMNFSVSISYGDIDNLIKNVVPDYC